MGDASVWVPSAAVVIVGGLNYLGTRRVHREVKTGNTKTAGQLAAITRGRQIDTDVAEGDQTDDERHYVAQYLEERHEHDRRPPPDA